jgi:hypothetical protein
MHINFKKIYIIFKNFLSFVGGAVIIFLLLLFFYGESAKQRRNLIFNTIDSFIGLGEKYNGFVANTPNKYFRVLYLNVKNKFKKFDYPSVYLEVNFKNLKNLDLNRKRKFNHDDFDPGYVNASLKISDPKNPQEYKNIKVKLKPKGDREIHFMNLNSMSYKVDVRGKKNFVFGMEEMSIQKPVVRNYGWEILFHDLLKAEGIIGLDIVPVKFYRNGEYLGIFVIEESFSKELLEKQNRKEGPIITVNNNIDHFFPNLNFKTYSERYWLSEKTDFFEKSKQNLENIKVNFEVKNFNLFNYFDTEKWARYFALIDLLKMYHGASIKSVKLYYNPTTGLIEPIGYDGHFGSGYDDFSFIDLIHDPDVYCGWICTHDKNWLNLFFDPTNKNFIESYLLNLKRFTSKNYKNKIENLLSKKINDINNFFYSEYQSSDRVWFKGPLPYYFDKNVIYERQKKLIKKIEFIENYFDKINHKEFVKKKQKISSINKFNSNKEIINQLANENIYLSKGYWILNNLKLIDKNIFLEEGSIVILQGENSFEGKGKVFEFSGPGMITQFNGKINLSNVKFNKIKNIKIDGLNWSGAFNIINAKVIMNNVEIIDNSGEDAINIVGSKSTVDQLVVNNSYRDAVDIDFGELSFNKIICKTSGNDCLDTSGAFVSGSYLFGENIKDKLGSFGENSKIKIKEVSGKKVNFGVVSKDGSKSLIETLTLENSEILAASYKKKHFFGNSNLKISKINSVENYQNIKDKILLSKPNTIVINSIEFKNFIKNKKILKQVYVGS